MTAEDLDTLVGQWLAENEKGAPSVAAEIDWERFWTRFVDDDEASSIFSASDLLNHWALNGEHEPLWRFIVAACARVTQPNAVAYLAAGPLEDLLAKFGPQYIGRVEAHARSDPAFNDLLGGVWKASMTEDVRSRVQSIRCREW